LVSRELRKIALERIERLMDFAKKHALERPEIARQAVLLAMRIAQKARLRIPRRYRLMYCRKCGTPIWSPNTFTIRIRSRRSTHITIRCNNCGYIKRMLVKKKDRSRK